MKPHFQHDHRSKLIQVDQTKIHILETSYSIWHNGNYELDDNHLSQDGLGDLSKARQETIHVWIVH